MKTIRLPAKQSAADATMKVAAERCAVVGPLPNGVVQGMRRSATYDVAFASVRFRLRQVRARVACLVVTAFASSSSMYACGGETDSSESVKNDAPDGGEANGAAANGATGSGGAGSSGGANAGGSNGTAGSSNGGASLSANGSDGCIAGQEIACVCSGGETGTQTCAIDGSAFGPCACPLQQHGDASADRDGFSAEAEDGGGLKPDASIGGDARTNDVDAKARSRDAGREGGAAADAAVPEIPCDSDLDCTPQGLLCDMAQGVCVECLQASQCDGDNVDCVDGRCESFVPCNSSLDCTMAPGGKRVCRPKTSRCVECVTAADCSGDDICVGNECVCHDCGPRWTDECIGSGFSNCAFFCESRGEVCSSQCEEGGAEQLCSDESVTIPFCGGVLTDEVPRRCCCEPVDS